AGGGTIGLWRVGPGADVITQLSTNAPGFGVQGGETAIEGPPSSGNPDAWWTSDSGNFSDSIDPHVYFQYLSGASGQHGEVWFSRPGFHLDVIGADTMGNAIVVAESTAQIEVWLLATPNSANQLQAMPNSGNPD